MRRPTRLSLALLATALAAGWVAAQTPASDPVVVVLQTEATVVGDLVRVGDVARITGGAGSMRDAFAKLDLADWSPTVDRLVVSRNDVKFRLLIRGFDERSF